MFRKIRETYDDRCLRENFRPRSLSLGRFFEIHISSLLDKKLSLHSAHILSNGRELSMWSVISSVLPTKKPIKIRDNDGLRNMISFYVQDQEYIVDEGEFSRIIKKCFMTTSTLCFSDREEDHPDILEGKK